MKITTLIENLVYQPGLVAEHGLSFYLEGYNKKILFDTGQSDRFIQNASVLGINICDVDALVISHGHYDHTGGFEAFLKLNSNAAIYMKQSAMDAKFHGKNRFIGTSVDSLLLKNRIHLVEEITEIDKGVFIMPNIPLINSEDSGFKDFFIKDGDFLENDTFKDELFLTIIRSNKLSIVSSCSHRGITNMISEAVKSFILSIDLVLGGFHLKNCSQEQYNEIVEFLCEIKPERLGVSHCTGIEQYFKLKRDCPFNVFYNMTGNRINI